MKILEAKGKNTYNTKAYTRSRASQEYAQHANFSEMKKRISFLSTLQHGWDGYNAFPISSIVIENVHELLSSIDEDCLSGWRALPEINGTISLQNDMLRAGIQIGDKTLSYFVIRGDNVTGEDNVAFSISNFVNILKSING